MLLRLLLGGQVERAAREVPLEASITRPEDVTLVEEAAVAPMGDLARYPTALANRVMAVPFELSTRHPELLVVS